MDKKNLVKIEDWLWEIPKKYRDDMRVPARVYASEEMLDDICGDRSLDQLVNVATLPGIRDYALAMPDIHEGYGFPIGGVAAFDKNEGVISPGGIGYDINCGVRLLKSQLSFEDVKSRMYDLGHDISREVPSGVGRGGRFKFEPSELDKILSDGAARLVEMGHGKAEDLECLESGGCLKDADPSSVSKTAKARGKDQVGTMGAGNHFVEVDVVDEIFDEKAAEKMGLFEGQVVFLLHTGSRGLGHQVATDYIKVMMKAMQKYKISLPDRELACVPFKSPEGRDYWGAMSAAANFAWGNRQLMTCEVRRSWKSVFGQTGGDLDVVYDVSHNLAKLENDLVVHRKGATRAFPDQPVLIPGSMGTCSYVLLGQEKSMTETFGSTCHGAGRRMSRKKAKKEIRGAELKSELEGRGIVIKEGSLRGLAEEAPDAYKDVNEVVKVIDDAGVAKIVAKLKPVAVVKG